MDALQNFFGIESFNFEENKKLLIDNLNYLKSLDVTEQTFYKKHEEIQSYKDYSSKLNSLKAKIWVPIDINNELSTVKEIESINPTLIHVTTPQENEDWTLLRIFGHTMSFEQTPGRFLKFLVTDGNKDNPRYIGVISMSSDVISINVRDKYLGWTEDDKLISKKLVHSAIGSCIMSTQPIGYNFLGGKLIATLTTSEYIRNVWKSLYGQTLVGMTTTSLYGSYSMYNSLKWWHKCGSSAGKISIKPNETIYKLWHDWIKENHADQYDKSMTQKEGVSGPVTGAKSRVISMIFSKCGIKQSDYFHGYERGVYYSCFYENSKEFFQNKITEDKLVMKPLFKDDKNAIMSWWIPKAIDRYKKLKLEGNLKPDIHFYDGVINLDYSSAKETYFHDVGR